MTKKDYYSILGISKSASKEEIKKAYKDLAKKHHPDITKDKNTEEKFKEISEAYAVLSDDQKRAQYDQFGHEAFDQRYTQDDIFRGFDFDIFRDSNFSDFDNIFDIFFGKKRTKKRGINLGYDLEISFEEAAFGVKKQIQIPKNEFCSSCNGSGANISEFCSSCNGSGQLHKIMRTPFGTLTQVTTCNKCYGNGKIIKEKCKTCNGEGTIEKIKNIEISIPPGVDNGTQIRLEGEGEFGESQAPGDLYIAIHVLPHKQFHRENYDLYIDIPIKFTTAVLGGKIEVPTLKGSAKLKIPPGTKSHITFRLKNEGIKKLHNYGHGDEYVRVIIEVPKKINIKQKKILEDFDKIS